MHRRTWLWLLGLTLIAAPLGAWQEGEVVTPKEDEAVHDELRALRDALVEGINAGDFDLVLAQCTENITLTTPDAAVSRGHEGVRSYYESKTKGPDRVVESFSSRPTVDELTVLYGDDTGVATGTSIDHFEMTNGMEFDMHNRWSATLVRQDGQWKLANYHTSTDVFDNPLLAAAKTSLYWAGGIALIIGVAVGWLIGSRTGRRAAQS